MRKNGLLNTLREFLPANRTPLLEEAILAVEQLPGVGKWVPAGPFMTNMIPLEVVLWGFPLTFLADVPSLDPLRKKIGGRIGNSMKPKSSDLSEVSAAALATVLGARELERIKTTNSKTPDFHIWWEEDLIEMEVTRADQKETLIHRSAAVDRLRREILSFERQCDIVVHVADIPHQVDRQKILAAAREVEPGTQIEEYARWHVRAETPRREGNYHVAAGQSDPPPAWWPEMDVARLFSLEQRVGGSDPNSVHPQVRVQFGTPFTSYINVAAKKANHFQGTGEVPFVIALDVMSLPGAFDFFPRELPEYLKAWPRVSGVWLIHGPSFVFPKIGWSKWRFIENTDARYHLPEKMVQKLCDEPSCKTYDLISN
jgi:hypothetical protein